MPARRSWVCLDPEACPTPISTPNPNAAVCSKARYSLAWHLTAKPPSAISPSRGHLRPQSWKQLWLLSILYVHVDILRSHPGFLPDPRPPALPSAALPPRSFATSYPHSHCSHFPGCGKLTGVSNPITIRAMGSRFGSWMTDTMAPSADSRVSDPTPVTACRCRGNHTWVSYLGFIFITFIN